MTTRRAFTAIALLLASSQLAGCLETEPPRATGSSPTSTLSTRAPANPTSKPSAAVASSSQPSTALAPGLSGAKYRELIEKLSEPDAAFFSDNFISNETSYLQVAKLLGERARQGGTYLGVGPEQNFSYIALSKPRFAYIVDIRRGNMILQLLYKAAFDLASSRAHFLSLLTARPYVAAGDPGAAATLEQVMQHTDKSAGSEDSYRTLHKTLRQRIEKGYGIGLDDADRRTLRRAHRAFFKGGLDIRFKLKEKSFRKYPSLRELLLARSVDKELGGFLATEKDFRFVQKLQRENRIVPLVGNFAGDRALVELAKHLRDTSQVVSAFYVSNVEQYLMLNGVWWKWQRNIAALPIDKRSLFIRAYLNQGQPHPKQLAGHRTATTLQLIEAFNARKKPYPSMLALASDGELAKR